jgi:hypothetical protein
MVHCFCMWYYCVLFLSEVNLCLSEVWRSRWPETIEAIVSLWQRHTDSGCCIVNKWSVINSSLCWLVPPSVLKKVLPDTKDINLYSPHRCKKEKVVADSCVTLASSQLSVMNYNCNHENDLPVSWTIYNPWSRKTSERYVNPLSRSIFRVRYSTSHYLLDYIPVTINTRLHPIKSETLKENEILIC